MLQSRQYLNCLHVCGVFVCAFMERLVRGEEAVDVTYDTGEFRAHLVMCLHNGVLDPFPTHSATKVCRKKVFAEKTISVVFSCRKPW